MGLTKTVTFSSFESWKQNLIFTLALDSQFAPVLLARETSPEVPLQGQTNRVLKYPEFYFVIHVQLLSQLPGSIFQIRKYNLYIHKIDIIIFLVVYANLVYIYMVMSYQRQNIEKNRKILFTNRQIYIFFNVLTLIAHYHIYVH